MKTAEALGLTFDEARHEYRLAGQLVPSVTGILKDNGLIDDRWFTEAARQRGQAVHAAAHYLDEGDLDWSSVHPELVGYLRSWEAYKAHRKGPRIDAIELRVFDPLYQVAGTLDRVMLLGNSRWIIDLKTVGAGSSASAPSWARFQTAAYEAMFRREYGGPMLRRGAIVLQADGSLPRLVEYEDAGDWSDFLAMTQATHIRRRLNRGKE